MLVDFAQFPKKPIMYVRRVILIAVKLNLALVFKAEVQVLGVVSQNTAAKHQSYCQLPLKGHVQPPNLCPWQDEHPNVDGDIDSGMPISESIDVEACTLVLAIPACPKV